MDGNTDFSIVVKKIRYMYRDQYAACLTPSEVCSIKDKGAVLAPYDEHKAERDYVSGISNPRWVYFSLPESLKKDVKR